MRCGKQQRCTLQLTQLLNGAASPSTAGEPVFICDRAAVVNKELHALSLRHALPSQRILSRLCRPALVMIVVRDTNELL